MDRHVSAWLNAALTDAERRGLPELKPLLEGLAHSLSALRMAHAEHEARLAQPSAGAADDERA